MFHVKLWPIRVLSALIEVTYLDWGLSIKNRPWKALIRRPSRLAFQDVLTLFPNQLTESVIRVEISIVEVDQGDVSRETSALALLAALMREARPLELSHWGALSA
jgi:hypothetical protein